MFVDLEGIIRRRVLLNYRIDADRAQAMLPEPFRPQLLDGAAVAGVCLIRLERLRPAGLPAAMGLASENAAHRIAVEWDDADGAQRKGVYIPRRDSGSRLVQWAGGRLVHTIHHAARFTVRDDGSTIALDMRARDGEVAVKLRARAAADLPESSWFPTLAHASRFFEDGCVGFSPTGPATGLAGIRLATAAWKVAPLEVEQARSSLFTDAERFPPGTAEFDCALVMRDIAHRWHAEPGPTVPVKAA